MKSSGGLSTLAIDSSHADRLAQPPLGDRRHAQVAGVRRIEGAGKDDGQSRRRRLVEVLVVDVTRLDDRRSDACPGATRGRPLGRVRARRRSASPSRSVLESCAKRRQRRRRKRRRSRHRMSAAAMRLFRGAVAAALRRAASECEAVSRGRLHADVNAMLAPLGPIGRQARRAADADQALGIGRPAPAAARA